MTRCVLVVDDEEDIRSLLVKELQSAGYDTVELESGERVVETALEIRPDVIVLDLTMPGVTGYEALEGLKANPQTAGIAVIIASALTAPGISRVVRSLGAADFLPKPWREGELVRLVEQAIDSAAD